MNITELKVREFIDLLSTDAPAPGGGAAGGLAGGIGVALCSMVIALTQGKEKYKEFEPLMNELMPPVTKLKNDMLDSMLKDVEVYTEVSKAYKMPKDTEEEKQVKSEAIQKALKEATKVPFELMELSYEALLLTEKAVGKSNPNASSDLGVAALMLKAAVQSGWLNVIINLSGIKDKEFVADYNKKGEELLAKMCPLCDKVYKEVLENL